MSAVAALHLILVVLVLLAWGALAGACGGSQTGTGDASSPQLDSTEVQPDPNGGRDAAGGLDSDPRVDADADADVMPPGDADAISDASQPNADLNPGAADSRPDLPAASDGAPSAGVPVFVAVGYDPAAASAPRVATSCDGRV
ncbi:MAG: hypothetical protein H7X95_01190, partial [Deltaproteobacteria bacterium]|nr:hypothetical protein [Deltaproteobacteria bacterium]